MHVLSIAIVIMKSLCEMAQYLLQMPGVNSVLSNRLCCQDLLEQFFCKQRQQRATNDNLYQNIYATKKGAAPLK